MVLNTRGRATDRERRTPLWYVRDGDTIYCFSGWGSSSDWFKNLVANPEALIQVGNKSWPTRGVFIQELPELERLLHRFSDKYGRLVPLFYHLDRLQLVAFPLSSQKKVREKMRDAN
jgi:deazaflavin-dependent oxidoreductase (nitroreductase family)